MRRAKVKIEYTTEFKRNVRALAKKYRNIYSDVQPILNRLQVGETLGDRVPRTQYTIFKDGYEIVISPKASALAIG